MFLLSKPRENVKASSPGLFRVSAALIHRFVDECMSYTQPVVTDASS